MAHLLTLLGTKFSPATLPGLTMWLDAQDYSTLTFNSTTISGWQDKSGKGNHATQATAIRQPKYQSGGIVGRPALEFRHDGSNASQLTIADSATLDYSAFTVFAVHQRVSDLGAFEAIGGKWTPNEHYMAVFTGDNAGGVISDGTNTDYPAVAGTIATGTPLVQAMRFSSGAYKIWNNSNGGSTYNTLTAVYNGTALYYLGSLGGGFANPYAGRIGEYLFFTRALSEGERQAVVSYLGGKWGFAV